VEGDVVISDQIPRAGPGQALEGIQNGLHAGQLPVLSDHQRDRGGLDRTPQPIQIDRVLHGERAHLCADRPAVA